MATVNEILQGQGESLLLHSHLMQMLTFVRGGGVELLPNTDQGDIRKNYLDGWSKFNKLSLKIRSMVVQMISQGRLLLYLRQTGKEYPKLESYARNSYRAFYNADGELESAVVIYSYKLRDAAGQPRDRWVWLRITATTIEKAESDGKYQFEQEVTPDSVVPNSFGFIPCVEVLNPPPGSERLGESDFEALSAQIEAHDEMTTAILDNLDFFAYSPILTSREPEEISDLTASGSPMNRDSIAEVSGFGDMPNPFKGTMRQRRRNRRLKKVIGNVGQEDLIQQLEISSVPANQIGFADAYERQLRESMGGILERGIETATESRLVYGKVEVTSREKREALFTYGLCQIAEMALLAEEAMYAASRGKLGLPPIGERSISFRVAPVFVQTAKDIQDRSIVGRNLQELGVNAKETLKFVFPDKRESEIDRMVGNSGLPFRYLQQTVQAIGQMSGLIDPLTGQPMVDPRTGLPLVYALIPRLLESLDYGQQFAAEPASTTSAAAESAAINAALARLRAKPGGMGNVGATAASGDVQPLPSPGSTVSSEARGAGHEGGFFDFGRSPILRAIRGVRG